MAATPETSQDTAGVIVRPPYLYLGALLVGLVATWIFPVPLVGDGITFGGRVFVGALLVAGGIAIARMGRRKLLDSGTQVSPYKPSTALVTDGIYRFSRNPLYVCLTAIYLGLSLVFDSLWAMALLIPVLITMRYGVIAREEVYLEKKFGEPYRQYKQQVRRWL